MTQDSFTEITHESWRGRIGKSIGGIFFGIILIAISFILLFWNEGRSVKTAQSLYEGAKSVISISSDSIDPANESKLIHLTGTVNTDERLSDPEFGISVNAIKLSRDVVMYQWKESTTSKTQKEMGGGTTTEKTYTYNKVWSESLIKSTNFKKSEGHRNPDSMPYQNRDFIAKNVKIGDTFALSDSLISKMNNYESYNVYSSNLPKSMSNNFHIYDGGYYYGMSPHSPEIGDVKVSFKVIKPRATVSLVTKQAGNSFLPYRTKVGNEIELLRIGYFSADDMFEKEISVNSTLTWILRGVGYFLMFLGFSMVFAPLSVLADVLPILGNLVGLGTGLVSFILATGFSFLTIAIAWFVYRPLLGIVLVVVAVAPFVLVPLLKKK